MKHGDLTSVETHFAFGENWKAFAQGVDRDAVEQAARGLRRLFSAGELANASFFDIGSGSGLHMVAAHQLGAAAVQGIDIDPSSVQASRHVLSRFLPDTEWIAREKSVFELTPAQDGMHDVVYSWGVLHHTGDMWPAIERALTLVKPGGLFAMALYRKTPFCGAWTIIKRIYSSGGRFVQLPIRAIYKTVFVLGLLASGRNPARYIREYRSNRGMSWHHDVHDWLGGYPYESVEPEEVVAFLEARGFELVRSFTKPAVAKGLLGTHCDEFVAVRRA